MEGRNGERAICFLVYYFFLLQTTYFAIQFGGPAYFFSQFYITSLCPLGFTKDGKNYNFYDSKELQEASMPLILSSLRTQMPYPSSKSSLPFSLSLFLSFSLSLFDHPRFGASKKVAICLGTGKISTVLNTINRTHHFFDHILQVEHPRYIVQYKRARINEYPSSIFLYIFLEVIFDFKIDI